MNPVQIQQLRESDIIQGRYSSAADVYLHSYFTAG